MPLSAEKRILELLKKLWILPADIRLAAHANNLRFRPRSYSHVGQVPMLDIFDKPIADWDSVAKRGFDPILGARPLRRALQRDVEDSLAEKFLFGELRPGQIVLVDVAPEGSESPFTFTGTEKHLPDSPMAELAGHGEATE